MRRPAIAIMLGLLTTLAAAWALAAFVPVPMYPRRVVRAWLDADDRAWSTAEVRLPGVVDSWWDDLADSYTGTPEEILAANRATMQRLVEERRGTDQHMRWAEGPPGWGSLRGGRAGPAAGLGSDTAYGFPVPCLWYSVRSGTQQGSQGIALVNEQLVGGFRLAGQPSARGRDFRALPYLPIWTALVIDVACWSGVWIVVVAGAAMLRGRLRLRRGRCLACGYDLSGLEIDAGAVTCCPECGSDQSEPYRLSKRRT